MTPATLTPDDWRHTALVDDLATIIHGGLAEQDLTVHAGVLATLLARLLIAYPPAMRAGITDEHLKLAQGLVELLELQAADRQAN